MRYGCIVLTLKQKVIKQGNIEVWYTRSPQYKTHSDVVLNKSGLLSAGLDFLF